MALAIDVLEGRGYNVLVIALTAFVGAFTIATFFVDLKASKGRKRRLTVAALPVAPLLTKKSQGVSNLTVEYDGRKVFNPQIVTFLLDNYGDESIDSSSFDQNRPIRLDVGVPILEVLEVSVHPGSSQDFAHASEGTAITLGPDVLKPRQGVTVQLLVDGDPNLVPKSVMQEHLPNTEVEYVSPLERPKFLPRPKSQKLVRVAWVIPTVTALAFLLLGIFFRPNANVRFEPADAHIGQTINIVGSGFHANRPVQIAVECGGASDPLFGTGGTTSYPIAEVAADAKGRFRASAVIPNVPGLDDCRLQAGQAAPSGWGWPASARQDF